MNIENETLIASYYLNNFDKVDYFQKDYFQNEKLTHIISGLEIMKVENRQFSLETLNVILAEEKTRIPFNELRSLKEDFSDYSNIDYHISKLKNDYVKQVTSKELLAGLTAKVNSEGDVPVDYILDQMELIRQSISRSDDNIFLDSQQLIERYLQTLDRREDPLKQKSMGFKCLDDKYTRPGAPGEISMTLSLRGVGKSAFRKNMANNLINKGIPVVVYSIEMIEESEMDRDIALKSGIKVFDLNKNPKVARKDPRFKLIEDKFRTGMHNYLFTDDSDISFDKLDSSLYKAKQLFRKKNVLATNENYMFVIIDVLNMISDFDEGDPRTILKCMDKLHRIAKKHDIHIHGIGQINETRLRGRTFREPEETETYRPNLEDIYGGSAYAQRARIVNILHRPKFLKERFFPDRQHIWDLEPDILQYHCVKQNDGELFLQEFIFMGEVMRVVPYVRENDDD
jgi:replicative DNA helicase